MMKPKIFLLSLICALVISITGKSQEKNDPDNLQGRDTVIELTTSNGAVAKIIRITPVGYYIDSYRNINYDNIIRIDDDSGSKFIKIVKE